MGKIGKIIKISASWCSPCMHYRKTFNSVKEMDEYKDIPFEEIDIEENDDVVRKYGVKSVPTTLILDENLNEVYKVIGAIPQNDLTLIINEAIRKVQ